jgi:hypothetical protein
MEVVTFSSTKISWDIFEGILNARLRRKLLPNKKVEPNSFRHNIYGLGSLKDPTFSAFKDAGVILHHISLSMFVLFDSKEQIIEVMSNSKHLVFLETSDDLLFVLTASLGDWKSCLLSLAAQNSSDTSKLLANKIIIEFDRVGLSCILENYSRAVKNDLLTLREK